MTCDGHETSPASFCSLCGGALDSAMLVHDQPDRFERAVGIAAAGYTRAWRSCAGCGSATNEHLPGNRERLAQIAAAYYDVDFAGGHLGAKFTKVMGLPPEKSDNAGRVDRVLRALQRFGGDGEAPLRALDIGAGLGVFLTRLLAEAPGCGFDIDATAIEPDPTAAEHLRSLTLFKVEEGLFTGQERFSGADLISLNKVLEHLADPVSLLSDVARALDDRGLAYVEVPDVATIGNRPPTDNILGALHCHLYAPAGLTALIRRCGLEALWLERVFEPSGKITLFAFACRRARLDRLAHAKG